LLGLLLVTSPFTSGLLSFLFGLLLVTSSFAIGLPLSLKFSLVAIGESWHHEV
jgi:hypothetical protein